MHFAKGPQQSITAEFKAHMVISLLNIRCIQPSDRQSLLKWGISVCRRNDADDDGDKADADNGDA